MLSRGEGYFEGDGLMRYLLITIFFTLSLIAKEHNATEIIHGHTLPPEPDSTINNATLGGVDKVS